MVVPWPGLLSRRSSPPSSCTACLTMDRPSPVPPSGLGAALVHPVEALEHLLLVLLGNADARVAADSGHASATSSSRMLTPCRPARLYLMALSHEVVQDHRPSRAGVRCVTVGASPVTESVSVSPVARPWAAVSVHGLLGQLVQVRFLALACPPGCPRPAGTGAGCPPPGSSIASASLRMRERNFAMSSGLATMPDLPATPHSPLMVVQRRASARGIRWR